MVENFGWGLIDVASTGIAFLDQAFMNSNVPLNTSLTDMKFMNPASTLSLKDILFAVAGEEGEFTGILAATNRIGADIISANTAGTGGIAFLNDPSIAITNPRIQANGTADFSFTRGRVLAHETGHNLGLEHDIFGNGANRRSIDDNCGLPECWARGYSLRDPLTGQVIYQSIMNPSATGALVSGSIPSFSNPDQACQKRRECVRGVPTQGIDGRPSSGADAALSLRTYAVGDPSDGVPNQRMLSALLPTSRFVATGEAATVFMTVINPNTVTAEACIIQHHGPDRDSFIFQATDPATNAPVGDINVPIDISAGGFQTFVISLTPSTDISGIVFAPFASCANAPMAAVTQGLNTLVLGADMANGPDLIALSATLNSNGIVDVPDGGFGVFSVATVNIGGAGTAEVSARSLDPLLPATALVCQTDDAGACMDNPTPTVSLMVDANGTPTFGVFIQTAYPTLFDASQRFQFEMSVNGILRGATSVAVRDMAPLAPPTMNDQSFSLNATKSQSGALADFVTGFATTFEIVSPPGNGTVVIDPVSGIFTYSAAANTGIDSFTYRALNPGGVSNTATASISINALPLPTVQNATFEDDVDGLFQVDLDTLAGGDIDQFVILSAPNNNFALDPVSGFLEVPLPAEPGTIEVQFAAKNLSGQSTTGTITINMVPLDACMPLRATKQRLLRRLTAIETDTSGLVSIEEAQALLDTMCLPPFEQGSTFVSGFDTDRTLFFSINLFPFLLGWDVERYQILYQTPEVRPLPFRFHLCKQAGDTTFFECPLK